MEAVKKAYRWICRAEEWIAQVLLVITVLLVFVSAVARSFDRPLGWGMDMATFLFAWTAFFAADVALRNDRHVNVSLFVDRLPEKVQYVIKLLNYGIILVFLGYLIRYGISMALITRFRTFQGIPGFSYMWAALSVPVGGLLLSITTVIKAGELIKRDHKRLFRADHRGDVKAQG